MATGKINKLSDDDKNLIRQLLAERDKLRAQVKSLTTDNIARKFECHVTQIQRIEKEMRP